MRGRRLLLLTETDVLLGESGRLLALAIADVVAVVVWLKNVESAVVLSLRTLEGLVLHLFNNLSDDLLNFH